MKILKKFSLFGTIYCGLLVFAIASHSSSLEAANPAFGTIPSSVVQLQSNNFECSDPLRLAPWTIHNISGTPEFAYARERFLGSCDASGWFEHLEGIDSLVILSQDIETPPDPGKPFDLALSQTFSVTPDVDYSVSGWMVSFCGGSANPSDCPDGYYMAKMVGLDPAGGNDPLAADITWAENRQNFLEEGQKVGWVNLRTAVRATASNMTVFARMNSPFRWHGNHGDIDAISVVRAPIARFNSIASVIAGQEISLTWVAEQSPDISDISGGAYQLLVDLEVRRSPAGEWKPLITGAVNASSAQYSANCLDATYEFRIRARSEQSPDVGPGVFPNHRYPGVWSAPVAVQVVQEAAAMSESTSSRNAFVGDFQIFLPVISSQAPCLD